MRRHSQQNPQRVEPLVELGLQLRDRRLGLAEDILRLIDGKLACGAAAEPRLGDLQRLKLLDDVVAGDLDLPLRRADADIGCRHVAEQRHQHVVVGRDRGEIGGVSGLDPAPELAPEIELPGCPGAQIVGPEIARPERDRRRFIAAQPRTGDRAGGLL